MEVEDLVESGFGDGGLGDDYCRVQQHHIEACGDIITLHQLKGCHYDSVNLVGLAADEDQLFVEGSHQRVTGGEVEGGFDQSLKIDGAADGSIGFAIGDGNDESIGTGPDPDVGSGSLHKVIAAGEGVDSVEVLVLGLVVFWHGRDVASTPTVLEGEILQVTKRKVLMEVDPDIILQ